MNILKKLLLRRKNFQVLPQHKDRIKKAFVHDGIEFFMFDDITKMPTCRGLYALDIYDEFAMRCTRDFLTRHCDAIDAVLNNDKHKIDLVKLAVLYKNLKERLTLLPLPDHIFRLASVVFFDKSENPYTFDRKYADEKVVRWKRDPDSLAFFLSTPLTDLIPFLDLQHLDLHTYSAIIHQVNQLHLDEVLSTSSMKGTKVDM
jgi:hypothetical protein